MARGKPRHPKKASYCGDCMSWNCERRTEFMDAKIDRRRKEGVHFSCGNNPCTCRKEK